MPAMPTPSVIKAKPPPEVAQRIAQAVVRKSRQLKEKPPEPGPDVRHRNIVAAFLHAFSHAGDGDGRCRQP